MYKIRLMDGSCYEVNINNINNLLNEPFLKLSSRVHVNTNQIVEIVELEEQESLESQMKRAMEETSYKSPLSNLSEEQKEKINAAIKKGMENFEPKIMINVPQINISKFMK